MMVGVNSLFVGGGDEGVGERLLRVAGWVFYGKLACGGI